MSGRREAQTDGSGTGSPAKLPHPPRLPRPSGAIRSAGALWISAQAAFRSFAWGPGAGVEAAGRLCHGHNGQGSQADLSLPSSCQDVSYSKAGQHGSHQSPGLREEECDCTGFGPPADESVSPPESTKGLPGDGAASTDVRAWGRW